MLKAMHAASMKKLESWFSDYSSAVIAFSGGVDSSLSAYLARKFLGRPNTVAVIGKSASLKTRDLEQSIDFVERYGICRRVVETDELHDENYVKIR